MTNAKAICLLFMLCYALSVGGQNETHAAEGDESKTLDLKMYRERLDNQTKAFERGLKGVIKGAVKGLLPSLMSFSGNSSLVSSRCMGGMMKYISGLTSVKVWAIKMLDATSKIPAGIFDGTLNDFGAFDECLEIYLPTRSGKIEFTGQYCAIEARPKLLPVPKNFSLSKQQYAKPLDSIGQEVKIAGMAFYYLKFRLGICVPSTCSLEDMQGVASLISKTIQMDVEIPQCYVNEGVVFQPIHIAVIFILSLLLVACITGSVVEFKAMGVPSTERKLSRMGQVLVCFSLISNFRRLMSASKGSEELKALHGIRALSIFWVILGHTYVWINFQLLRRPNTLVIWFNSLDFGSILNGWMSVEPFFLLSGLLTSFAALKILPKTKGRINIPLYILRRYLRLTPPLLLAIGLLFFIPLLSTGPFWYERVDPEIRSCTQYWWRSILYISNWFGMKNICVHPTWYLSADFQLHVITVGFLILLYRFPKLGLSLIAALVVACTAAVGALTYSWNLPPIILISSGNDEQIQQTIDIVHMSTFTHAGPYYVGIVAGYLIHKYKDIRMNEWTVIGGWLLSIIVSLTSLYGAHRWNIGEPHGPLLTAIYASLHRTTFTVGVAWVAFACVTGHGGLVNRILSSPILAPVSRLTFLIYLLHSLVIWIRVGSRRERVFYSHYNLLYEYVGNLVVSLLVTIPFYLLLEAPVSNLERLLLSRAPRPKESEPQQVAPGGGHLRTNLANQSQSTNTMMPVQLKSVKNLESGGRNNAAFCEDRPPYRK